MLGVAVALWLRLHALDTAPAGLDLEEAAILYWARKGIETGNFWAYAPEGAAWENLPGTIFHLLGRLVPGPERLVPSLVALAEVAATGLLAGRWLGRRAGWTAAALIALCPWHVYYGRTFATSVGAGLLVVAAVMQSGRAGKGAVLRDASGLLYYTVYRIVALRLAVEYMLTRNRRGLAILAGASALALAIVALSRSTVSQFFTRGSYNVTLIRPDIAENVARTWLAPFVPIPEAFSRLTDSFLPDLVHAGFALALGDAPPLGWGFAIVLALSLGALAWRTWREAAVDPRVCREAVFLAAAFTCLGIFGPQMTRLLIFLPLLALIAAWGLEEVRLRLPGPAGSAIVAAVLVATALPSLALLDRLGDRDRMERVFHSRQRSLARYLGSALPQVPPSDIYVFADFGYPVARSWVEEGGYRFLPSTDAGRIESLLRAQYRGHAQYVAVAEVPDDTAALSRGLDRAALQRTILPHLESRAAVLESVDVVVEGRRIARVLKIAWRYPAVSGISPVPGSG